MAFSRSTALGKDLGFREQIQRAAVSVMNNVAEGFEARTQKQFIDFLGHAKASAGEVRSQLYVAMDLGFIEEGEFEAAAELARKCSRQIYRLMEYLNKYPGKHRIRENGTTYLA